MVFTKTRVINGKYPCLLTKVYLKRSIAENSVLSLDFLILQNTVTPDFLCVFVFLALEHEGEVLVIRNEKSGC